MGDHEQWGLISQGYPSDFPAQRDAFLQRTGLPQLYREQVLGDVQLIFLGPDEDPGHWSGCSMSATQMDWLAERLAAAERVGHTAIVFTHTPPDDTLPYTFEGEQKHGGFAQSADFKRILSGYPDATVVCSHTHSPVAVTQPEPDGPVYVASSAVSYQRLDAHTEWSDAGLAYSNGLLLDVFSNRIEFTAWDFVSSSESMRESRSLQRM
jgi:hypothetical protein